MQIYTLDLYFAGTQSKYQGFPPKSVGGGKKVILDSFGIKFIGCLFLSGIHKQGWNQSIHTMQEKTG